MIKSRINEHTNPKNKDSHVIIHATKEHNGVVNFSWRILHSRLWNIGRRKRLESIYISRYNRCDLMNGCSGIKLLIS